MWPYPKIIAHRGAGTLAPENTFAAMRRGLSCGFHAVEFDVRLSRDAIPVVMHDASLGRTVAGHGNVADYTALELGAMDAGAWFDAAFAGESVPSYEEVFRFCVANRTWMNVEIKPVPGAAEQAGRVVAEFSKRLSAQAIASAARDGDALLLPLLSSFSFEALQAAKAAAPEIPRGYLVDAVPKDWHERVAELGAVALHANHEYLSAQQARDVKAAGFGLFCYTVNDPVRARQLLGWGVDAFCTDRIDLIGPDFC
jgi:glycerophosphoryl diester phosphodiesterase